MTAEALADSHQLDLGFAAGAKRGIVPLAEVRFGPPGTRVLAELMALQHIDDRSQPYFSKSSPVVSIDRQWASIARRNPEYRGSVLEIQRAMREARRANALANRSIGDDPVEDYYDEVTDPAAQAMLKDVLRLYTDFYGVDFSGEEENVYGYSTQIEEEVLAAFPNAVGDEGFRAFDSVSAADLFELMLEGRLTLPGHPIERKVDDGVKRKYFL
jgi:hypothetical protein